MNNTDEFINICWVKELHKIGRWVGVRIYQYLLMYSLITLFFLFHLFDSKNIYSAT